MPPPNKAEFSIKFTVPPTSTLDCIRDIPPPSFLLNTLVPLSDMGNLKLTTALCCDLSSLLPKNVLMSDQDNISLSFLHKLNAIHSPVSEIGGCHYLIDE